MAPPSSVLLLLLLLFLCVSFTLSDVLRLSCGNILTYGRVDAIIAPGAVVSNHAHVVYGASNFNPSVTYAQLIASSCATCQIIEDNSVYWFPALYYHNITDGTYTSVEQSPPGAAIYYLQRTDSPTERIVAFPAGFRMIAGNMSRRDPYTIDDPNFVPPVNYVCLNYDGVSSQSNNFPNVTCVDGLRAQLSFPSCWDGVNLDSPNHMSHVSYAVTENLNSGPCPSSHPVRIPALFAEVIYQTSVFPTLVNGQPPWAWSFTTPTTLAGNEYGYHGDFVNGWNISALQATVSSCTTFDSCPYVHYRPDSEASECGLQDLSANSPYVTEHLLGVLPKLIIGEPNVTNVNPYGAVNTYVSPSSPVCSTFPFVDYSAASPASYTYSARPVPSGATFFQAGQTSLSCAQAYVGWKLDTAYAQGGGTSGLNSNTAIVLSPRSAPLTPFEEAFPVFSTNRYGSFTYSIPVAKAGLYSLRLLFAENYWVTIGSRVFSVTAQGQTIISHLDLNTVGPNPAVPCTAGTRGALTQTTAYIFNTTVQVTAASLTVQLGFIAISDNPLVSAVEVAYVGTVIHVSSTASPAHSTAAATASAATSSRITSPVGATSKAAPPISPFSLYINSGSTNVNFTDAVGRQWVRDRYYNPSSGTWQGVPNGGAVWTNTTSDLYPLFDSNRVGNIAYTLPVPAAGSYRLTLHYAEMYWTAVGKRVFSVTVQGVQQVAALDLIAVTGHEYSAYNTTHLAMVGAGLKVSLVLSTIVDNALLCGIELIRLS